MLLSFSSLQQQFDFDDAEQYAIEILIFRAISEIESIIGREIEFKERISYFDGGKNKLFLKSVPVLDVVVYEDETRHFLEDSLLDKEDYFIEEEQGILELYDRNFIPGKRVLKIVYTAGYTEETLPDVIKKAISEIVISTYSKNMDRAYGKKSISSVNGTSVTYDFEMNIETKRALEKYRFVNL